MWDQTKILIRDYLIGQKNADRLTLLQSNAAVLTRRFVRAALRRGRSPSDPVARIHRYRAPLGHTFFGYYDVTPFSASNRLLLAIVAPAMNRRPRPDDGVAVGFFDRHDAKFQQIATSQTWCWQQGCRLQWHPANSEELVLYNTLVDDSYGAAIQNIRTHEVQQRLSRPVYALDRTGQWALSLNFSRLQRLRPGYGYVNIPDRTLGCRCPDDDGIWLTNLQTGGSKLILSLGFLEQFHSLPSMAAAEHYINHILFSPSGNAFMFFHLWVRDGCLHNRLIVCGREGANPQVIVDKGTVSHYFWKSDDELLVTVISDSMSTQYNLYRLSAHSQTTLGSPLLNYDGHPSYAPDNRSFLTDTYPDAFGEQHLLIVTPEGRVQELGRFYLPPRYRRETRCDLHPRWDRTGTCICFDSAQDGRRAMYVLELRQCD